MLHGQIVACLEAQRRRLRCRVAAGGIADKEVAGEGIRHSPAVEGIAAGAAEGSGLEEDLGDTEVEEALGDTEAVGDRYTRSLAAKADPIEEEDHRGGYYVRGPDLVQGTWRRWSERVRKL